MRSLLIRASVCTLAVCSLIGPSRAHSQTTLTPGAGWTLFEWFAPGEVEGGGFFLQALTRVRLRITDALVSGDIFSILINGTSYGTTSAAPDGVDTGAYEGDSAWGDPDLSKAELFLDAGEYDIQLFTYATATGYDYGEGFIRADQVPLGQDVPEPASMLLLGSGLVGVAGAARRRWRNPTVSEHA